MPCATCGTELLPGKSFCWSCGAPAPIVCASCGASLSPHFRFCPDCGRETARAEAPAPAPPAPAPPSPLSDPRLARFERHMPESLARRLREAGAGGGERKRVTVFFCDLVGSTALAERLDPEAYREILERFLELAFREIYRLEGIVNQLAGDGLMALFGAPVAAEDSPERAVRAALAVREALARLSEGLEAQRGVALHARFGIHTGMVVAGTVGNDQKMDYTATGDTTNLAARLQSLASPGAILVSEATHTLLRGAFRTRPLGALDVRGKSERVVAHEILGVADERTQGESAGPLTPFVGRAGELTQLLRCYEHLDGGLAQLVTVVGDAGLGKSRLVHEFEAKLAGGDALVVAARCSSLTRNVPYAPWVQILSRWFGITPGEAEPAACERVARALSESGGAGRDDPAFVHLCRVLSLNREEWTSESVELAKRKSFGAVQRLIERTCAIRPVVLVIEDLHWIDDASLEILELAAASMHTARFMLLTTHRPDFQARWQSDAALTQLRLRPIADDDARKIVRARAGGPLPEELEQRLLRRGEGNPFYLEELTRALVEEGTIARGADGVRITRRADEIRIPDTIGEVLGARIDRLPPEAKRVAQVASVLGRQFRREPLERLLDGENIDVRAQIAELTRRGVVYPHGSSAGDEFRFGESLTQEVAYEGLLLRERRRLHDRIAEALDEVRGDGANGAARALAAHHRARGEDRARGIQALLEAAREAQALPSYGDSMRLFREAWRLAELALSERLDASDALRRLALQAAVGVAAAAVLYGDSESDGDERIAQRGIELAEQLADRELHANLLSLLGMLVMNGARERFDEGVEKVERALELAERTPNVSVQASALRAVLMARALDGRFDEARELAERMADAVARRGDSTAKSEQLLGARFFMQRLLYDSDQLVEFQVWARESYEIAVAAKNRTIQSASASMLGGAAFLTGEYDESLRWLEIALPIAEEIESLAAIRSAGATWLLARAAQGRRKATQEEIARVERGVLASGDLGSGAEVLVEALLEVGELPRARRIALARAQRSGGRARLARSALMLGLVAARSGVESQDEAERLLLEASTRAKDVGLGSVQGRAQLALAELALARDDHSSAALHAEKALALLRALGIEHYAGRAARLLLAGLESSAPNA